MFNKNLKPAVWFLAIVVMFLAVAPVRAVKNFDPFREEEKITNILKNYKNTDKKISTRLDKILKEIKEEKPSWWVCLWRDEKGKFWAPKRYPELYYLWLVEKFDLIFDVLGEENDLVLRHIYPFIENLLDLVFSINRKAYFYYEYKGWTTSHIYRVMFEPGLL